MVFTDQAVLANRCDWIARRTSRVIRETGRFHAAFYFGKGPSPVLYKLQHPILDMSFSDGAAKDRLFAITRRMIEAMSYDCFVMVTDSWLFEPNERLLKLSIEKQRRLVDSGFQKLIRLGYGLRREALVVFGQTPAISHTVILRYKRIGETMEITHTESSSIDLIEGRAKMWGECYDSVRDVYNLVDVSRDLHHALRAVHIELEAP